MTGTSYSKSLSSSVLSPGPLPRPSKNTRYSYKEMWGNDRHDNAHLFLSLITICWWMIVLVVLVEMPRLLGIVAFSKLRDTLRVHLTCDMRWTVGMRKSACYEYVSIAIRKVCADRPMVGYSCDPLCWAQCQTSREWCWSLDDQPQTDNRQT